MSESVETTAVAVEEVKGKTGRKNHTWDTESKDFVSKHASILTDTEGARLLSLKLGKEVSVSSYRKVRQDLGIRKSAGRGVSKVVTAKPVTEEVKKEEEAAPEAVSPF